MQIPTYMKDLFWAGMKTIQRLESINGFFYGFVNKKTRLYQFVQQYENALEHRTNDEKNADSESSRFTQHCVTTFLLEKTFRKFYTDAKFSEVQLECMKTLYVRTLRIEQLDAHEHDTTLLDRV